MECTHKQNLNLELEINVIQSGFRKIVAGKTYNTITYYASYKK